MSLQMARAGRRSSRWTASTSPTGSTAACWSSASAASARSPASRCWLRGVDVSIIDNDIEMIQAAATFGFKVYYGDGTRLDMLHAAGAGRARGGAGLRRQRRRRRRRSPSSSRPSSRWCRCSRAPTTAATRCSWCAPASTTRSARPSNRRSNSAKTCWSGWACTPEEAAETIEDVRRRDRERLELQIAGDFYAGRGLMKGNAPIPAPLTPPRRSGQAMNPETADILAQPATDEP